jgi:hypothetical protein
VRSISLPGGSASEVDVTHLTSTAREFRLGLADQGTASLTTARLMSDAGQIILRALYGTSTVRRFRVTDAGSPAYKAEFDGLVQQIGYPSVDPDSTWTAEFSLRITGALTWSLA